MGVAPPSTKLQTWCSICASSADVTVLLHTLTTDADARNIVAAALHSARGADGASSALAQLLAALPTLPLTPAISSAEPHLQLRHAHILPAGAGASG